MKIINPYRFGTSIPATLTNDLVSWWSLDETSGTRVDSHGSNDLTDVNTVTYDTGKVSNAASFAAANSEYLWRGDADVTGLTETSFSVTGWFNYVSIANAAPRIICRGTVVARSFQLYALQSTTYIEFQNGVSAPSVGPTSSGTWYFFYIYLDTDADEAGISLNNGTIATASATGWPTGTTNKQLVIGRQQSLAGGRDWNGLIDEVGYWNRVLTAEEVTALYNSGNGIGYPG